MRSRISTSTVPCSAPSRSARTASAAASLRDVSVLGRRAPRSGSPTPAVVGACDVRVRVVGDLDSRERLGRQHRRESSVLRLHVGRFAATTSVDYWSEQADARAAPRLPGSPSDDRLDRPRRPPRARRRRGGCRRGRCSGHPVEVEQLAAEEPVISAKYRPTCRDFSPACANEPSGRRCANGGGQITRTARRRTVGPDSLARTTRTSRATALRRRRARSARSGRRGRSCRGRSRPGRAARASAGTA